MFLGTSEIDITPKPGVELSGFAARIQPSIGVLDPLYAKVLYLVEGEQKLLWIHCDLIGFDREIVFAFRHWAREAFGLTEGQVMLSATHTHSGACTIYLQEAGEYDHAYVDFLLARLREAATAAVEKCEEVKLVAVEGYLDLAVDRRKTISSHTDPRVGAVGFCRSNNTFAAVVVNYPMHPVALGSNNRLISADVPGQAALALKVQLPGSPSVLVTNGACANLNPPAENVPFTQITTWGRQIADSVASLLTQAVPKHSEKFRVSTISVPLPMEVLDSDAINIFAEKALQDTDSISRWGAKYRRVVEQWRSSLLEKPNASADRAAELFGICIGDVVFLGANAEVFSEFTDWLRCGSRKKVYFIGYANGDMGYLPTRAAYAEGGYEVDVAHLFYGGFRPKVGGLEMLAEQATGLLQGF